MSTPAQKRLVKDLERIKKEEKEEIMAAPLEDNIMLWLAHIEGP